MGQTSLHSMPEIVIQLRNPWLSLQEKIPHLTEELEMAFRFGHRVHHTQRGYLLGGNMKGGSSGVWRLCSNEEQKAYTLWHKEEGIREEEDPGYFHKLVHLLEEQEIEFLDGETSPFQVVLAQFHSHFGEVYQLTYEILKALPLSHLKRKSFSALQLGGWGPDSAKGSAYQNGRVMMYTFTLRGARRSYGGLLLHELGHVHESDMSSAMKKELKECYHILCSSMDFAGMEYLSDSNSRKTYQSFQFEEFLAETYLAYTALGQNLLSFIQGLCPASQKAWEKIYALFKESFEGVEYL